MFNFNYLILKDIPNMHYYALINDKYALKEKWIKYANVCNNNFDFVFYKSQNKFLSYYGTFIIKGKNA